MLWNFIEISLLVLLNAGILYWLAIFAIWFWGLLKEIIFSENSTESENEDLKDLVDSFAKPSLSDSPEENRKPINQE